MSVEFFSNSQHHLWERCRMKESFFWENLVEREISRRTLWDVSSLPGRPREISFSLAGSTTAWAVCIFRPISGPNGDLKTSLRVLYFHERSNPDADSNMAENNGHSKLRFPDPWHCFVILRDGRNAESLFKERQLRTSQISWKLKLDALLKFPSWEIQPFLFHFAPLPSAESQD